MQIMVSIVMPFFNRANLVVKMVVNIIEQSRQDWELLIIDDGSEESDYEIVRKTCNKDSRIVLEKRPQSKKKGAQSCRNLGLELAKGKYVIFFDSDDYIPPYCLEQRVNYMESHPELDFAVFPYAEYESDPKNPEVIGGYKFYNDDLKAFVSRTLPFMVWSNIYKTESLRNTNIQWDTNLKSLQDAFFNITVLISGLNYDYAERCLIDYYNRVGNKGMSISKGIYSSNHFDSHIYYLESVRNAVAKKGDMKKPLRDGCLYVYSIMMYNYSRGHSAKLIACLSNDKWFYSLTRIKDALYRNVLKKLHINTNMARWILFPAFSVSRKRILKSQRDYCAANALRMKDVEI